MRSKIAFVLLAPLTHAEEPPQDRFTIVNSVRLHYLDWGGNGETVVFFTSLGGTAGDFHPLAIGLTDHFRVLGLTRRGQGRSEKPVSGYDTGTLTEDIRAFLDAMNVGRATLVGYSLAGNEMTEFGGRYPKRVAKLVYLDAAYDLRRSAELARKGNLNLPPMQGTNQAMRELSDRGWEYYPDYARIQAAALGIFVTYDEPPKAPNQNAETQAKLLQWWFDFGKAYRREQIENFQNGIKRSTVVELHGTTHGGFVFEKRQQEIMIREMRKFLLEGTPR